jgi:hypothetical protein
MGINDLQLSPEIVALLYPETLVTSHRPVSKNKPPDSGPNQPPDKSLYSFSGKNLRSICVIVSTPDGGTISEEILSFLQKILEACRCTPDDIALIHIQGQQPDMEKLKSQFSPRIILFWGLQPEIPGFQYPLPDMVSVQWENITLLPVANADLMSRNNPEAQDLKRKLWTSLKKIFNL